MVNQDWEKLGETIRNTVQDAIDSQNFEQLNQTITNTINSAVDGFTQGMKTAGKQWTRSCGEQPVAQKCQMKPKTQLYRKTVSLKVWGYVSMITGGLLGLSFLLMLAVMIIHTLLAGVGNIYSGILLLAGFMVISVTGGIIAGKGFSSIDRASRFEEYVRKIGCREYCNIRELADGIGKKSKYVVKDLEYMIKKGWFREGHLDADKACLIVTDEMYDQYTRLRKERMQAEREEEEQRIRIQKQQKAQEKERQKEKMEYEKLAPQIRLVLEEGDAYIRKIHECNDAIPGEEISAKISHMELLVDRIFDRIEQSPESVKDIRRLMEYYLPTTVRLLEAYQELDSQPVDGENIRSSKAEIEATLDTLNLAFEKLLDDLFQDTAWDVSSDISVLRTMLAQEGLTENEWGK